MFSLYLLAFYAVLLAVKPTRKWALALTPWLIFACSYDCMRLYPNYKVNPIDVKNLFMAEKHLFGFFHQQGETLIPSQYFALHHNTFLDFMAGIFYLCWVPVPLLFGIYLYIIGEKKTYLNFSIAFLVVNLLGFIGYYLYPAAPPWYALNYGFESILHTPGNVAGLGRWDNLTGLNIFQTLYGKNANVFAAVPSLHSAYMLVATIYAIIGKRSVYTITIFSIICVGIWFTAVYTCHHYIIDVLLGILTAVLGIILLQWFVHKTIVGKQFIQSYIQAI